jgi:hypothetical protein
MYSTDRLVKGRAVVLARGYTSQPDKRLHGTIKSVKRIWRDCEGFIDCYGKPGWCLAITIEIKQEAA